MKLNDKIFDLFSPDQWPKYIAMPFPSSWYSLTAAVSNSDIIELTWSYNYLIVARYRSKFYYGVDNSQEELLSVIEQGITPNLLSVKCRVYTDLSSVIAEASCGIRVRGCKCCATLPL